MQFASSNYGDDGHEYADILNFSKEHNRIPYSEFDEHILHNVNLFDTPKDEYFNVIERTLDKIIRVLPSLKRIFGRPIIRLRDTQEIVPIETAHIINSDTLAHLSVHAELWADIKDGSIIPKKLMTVSREETYQIYENIIFVCVIDEIFKFLRRAEGLLRDVLYDYSDIHFNFLDRTHHASFFLAIGKLHIEYARAQHHQHETYTRCLEKIAFINRILSSKLKSPVYVHCKKKKKKLAIKKTNIFRVHKDYKIVYDLAKWIENDIDMKGAGELVTDNTDTWEAYKVFCIYLSIFAAGHFNFTFPKEELIDTSNLHTECFFQGWTLGLTADKVEGIDCILYSFKKDVEYKTCLILREKDDVNGVALKSIKNKIVADEYLFTRSVTYGETGVLYLSLFNIDSFRRIQQMLLRGMIYSDKLHHDCPFCGHTLKKEKTAYECEVCRAEIRNERCTESGAEYFVSGIKDYKPTENYLTGRPERRKFLHDRYKEAQLHFRNITHISADGEPICPKCGKIHTYRV